MLQRVRVTNSTVATIPAVIPTLTLPGTDVGDATSTTLINISNINAPRRRCRLWPYATASDGNTMLVRPFIWNQLPSSLWIASPAFAATATLDGTLPGVAGTLIPATMLFAKTLVINAATTLGPDLPFTNSLALAGSLAYVDFPLLGGLWLDVRFGLNSLSTDCNALYEFY